MIFRQLFDKETSTYTYLLGDEATREAVMIDTVKGQTQRDLTVLNQLDLKLLATVETHIHADHITGSSDLREQPGCQVIVPANSGVIGADRLVAQDDRIAFGSHELIVLETPGHTANCTSYLLENKAVFTGDAVLIRKTGRTDFQGGSAAQLYDSITKKIFTLADDVLIYPGHDYQGLTVSTVGEEKRFNQRLANTTRDDFVKLMNDLKLPLPKHIHEAVPGNLVCGRVSSDSLEVSPEFVNDHAQELTLIDVRGADEYHGELGHLETALLMTPQGTLSKVEDDAMIVTICRSGKRSLDAAKSLRSKGRMKVWSMQGGMLAWRERGLPLAEGS